MAWHDKRSDKEVYDEFNCNAKRMKISKRKFKNIGENAIDEIGQFECEDCGIKRKNLESFQKHR